MRISLMIWSSATFIWGFEDNFTNYIFRQTLDLFLKKSRSAYACVAP